MSKVVEEGEVIPSRFGPVFELIAEQYTFAAGDLVARPRLNRAIGWMELLQLIAGVFDPLAIQRVAPKAKLELFTAQMAYGLRTDAQMPEVITRLHQLPETRQAVVFIGGADRGATDSQPCTSSIQFIARHGYVNAVVTMRSWDLVKGLAYDVVMFGGLTQVVAGCLGLKPGRVVVTAGSAHVYMEELDLKPKRSSATFRILPPDLQLPEMWAKLGPLDRWETYVAWATDQIDRMEAGIPPAGIVVETGSWG